MVNKQRRHSNIRDKDIIRRCKEFFLSDSEFAIYVKKYDLFLARYFECLFEALINGCRIDIPGFGEIGLGYKIIGENDKNAASFSTVPDLKFGYKFVIYINNGFYRRCLYSFKNNTYMTNRLKKELSSRKDLIYKITP